MAQIGSVSCDFVHGDPNGLTERVDTWESPGVDGAGAQLLGQGAGQIQFVAVKYGTINDLETFRGDIEALVGTIVSIVDDWAKTHESILIIGTGDPKRTAGTPENRIQVTVEGLKVS